MQTELSDSNVPWLLGVNVGPSSKGLKAVECILELFWYQTFWIVTKCALFAELQRFVHGCCQHQIVGTLRSSIHAGTSPPGTNTICTWNLKLSKMVNWSLGMLSRCKRKLQKQTENIGPIGWAIVSMMEINQETYQQNGNKGKNTEQEKETIYRSKGPKKV